MGDAARKLACPPTLDEIVANPALLNEVDAERIPTMLAQLASMSVQLSARLLRDQAAPRDADELLDADAAANMLHMSTDYVYRNARRFSFTRRQGRKLLFSRNGIQRFIREGRR